MLGPHQNPIYIAWINPINSIIRNYENCIHTYIKLREKKKIIWKLKRN